ncbi:glutamate 5-kinase [Patescibacteria group bacterium]
MYKTVVLKIGTNVLTKQNGELDLSAIRLIVDQICELHEKGIYNLLVSSGAVGAGRTILPKIKTADEIENRQVLASIGQVELMSIYKDLFRKKNIRIAQILPTKSDFKDRNHYLNIKRCLQGLHKNKIIPIINENDTVSVKELMFTDNDELAGLIAAMIGADALIMGTVVDGVQDYKKGQTIKEIHADQNIQDILIKGKSKFGRGGMLTKLHNAQKIAKLGINVHIASGKQKDFLIKLCSGEKLGTFIPSKKKKDTIKRWLAFTGDQGEAAIRLDYGLSKILKTPTKIVSILPVGIKRISGSFKKGDLIEIRNYQNKKIGVGIAEYSSIIAQNNLGKSKKKAIIHYNNLYIN